MLNILNDFILTLTDPVLGWLLYLPSHLVIVIVATATSAILTFVRLFSTDQDLLSRCKQDKTRLKHLIREARRGKEKEARKRYRATVGQVSMKLMRAEGKPLLVSIVPIAFLAVWCFSRLAYIPPTGNEPITLKAYFKISAIGRLAHLVPQEGLTAEDGWVQPVGDDPDTAPGVQPNGLAVWTLRLAVGPTNPGHRTPATAPTRHNAPPPRPRTYQLAVHFAGRTYAKSLEVGGRTYAPPLAVYDDGPLICTEVVMKEFRPFGFVPGIPWIAMPPWLVAYLGIAIPFVFVLKRIFHIY